MRLRIVEKTGTLLNVRKGEWLGLRLCFIFIRLRLFDVSLVRGNITGTVIALPFPLVFSMSVVIILLAAFHFPLSASNLFFVIRFADAFAFVCTILDLTLDSSSASVANLLVIMRKVTLSVMNGSN